MSTVLEAARPALALADSRSARAVALWGMLIAKAVGGWGVQWDIRWHITIGRDSFWIAPHLMTYAGVTITALLALGILALDTWRARAGARVAGGVHVAGLVGTPGFHLAWWGIAMTILAAPIDDVWHRLFGIDVTLWSPPHLLGLSGAQLNSLGCLLIATELWPARSAARRVTLLVGGTLLLGAFYVMVDPATQTAFRRGGVFFFSWAVLGSLAFAFALVLVARLADSRSAPVAVALGALAFHALGLAIGDVGFAVVQPAPAIEAAIAADPDSPVAVAHEMARRNRAAPGRAPTFRAFPLLGAALMTLLDPRRRAALAAVGLAVGLFAVNAVMFGRAPAFAHALPSTVDALVALGVTALASIAGAAAAVRLAEVLRSARTTQPG